MSVQPILTCGKVIQQAAEFDPLNAVGIVYLSQNDERSLGSSRAIVNGPDVAVGVGGSAGAFASEADASGRGTTSVGGNLRHRDGRRDGRRGGSGRRSLLAGIGRAVAARVFFKREAFESRGGLAFGHERSAHVGLSLGGGVETNPGIDVNVADDADREVHGDRTRIENRVLLVEVHNFHDGAFAGLDLRASLGGSTLRVSRGSAVGAAGLGRRVVVIETLDHRCRGRLGVGDVAIVASVVVLNVGAVAGRSQQAEASEDGHEQDRDALVAQSTPPSVEWPRL